jgi:hypothetical protein
MTKERVVGPGRAVTEPKYLHLLRWTAGPSATLAMTKERVVVRGERSLNRDIFIFLGGPQALRSGRDEKGAGNGSIENGC